MVEHHLIEVRFLLFPPCRMKIVRYNYKLYRLVGIQKYNGSIKVTCNKFSMKIVSKFKSWRLC